MTGDIRGLKVGVARHYFFTRSQDHVVAPVEQALDVLRDLGAEIVDVDIDHIDHAAAAALAIYVGEATAYHDDTLTDRAHLYTETVRMFLELGDQLLAKDYLHAQRFRTLLGHSMAAVLADVDVIATPGIAITASPLGQPNVTIGGAEESVFGAILRNTEPFDLTGLPALVVPCGFGTDGMPVSLQIAGRAFDEATILNVGHAFQTATDWHMKRPAIVS